MAKIRMYESFLKYALPCQVFMTGIHADCTSNGTSCGTGKTPMDVILCQHDPFPLACRDGVTEFVIVEFLKDQAEIFVDYDDMIYVEEVAEYDLHGASTYENVPIEILENNKMFGSFVTDIEPHEIVSIHASSFGDKQWIMGSRNIREENDEQIRLEQAEELKEQRKLGR